MIAMKSNHYRLEDLNVEFQNDLDILEEKFQIQNFNCYSDHAFRQIPIYRNFSLSLELLKRAPIIIGLMNSLYINEESVTLFLKRNKPIPIDFECNFPIEIQMNSELLRIGMIYNVDNIYFFSNENPYHLNAILIHLKSNFQHFLGTKSGVARYFMIHHKIKNILKSKIYLFSELYLKKKHDLQTISYSGNEKKLLDEIWSCISRIYEKLSFNDEKNSKFMDIHFTFT